MEIRLTSPDYGKGAAGKWTDAATREHGDLISSRQTYGQSYGCSHPHRFGRPFRTPKFDHVQPNQLKQYKALSRPRLQWRGFDASSSPSATLLLTRLLSVL